MTTELLDYFIGQHRQNITKRYEPLKDAYESDHEILHAKAKDSWKPDNRIVVNFPKYMVDTTNGFFIGNPIKIVADEKAVSDFVEFIDQYNDQDDNNAELSKLCSIFGHAYEMYYRDEDSELCITYLSPMDAFMIYDDSIVERPMYFVRVYKDWEGNEYGSISNTFGVRHFQVTGGTKWLDEDWQAHFFDGVPATEYLENAERQSLFYPVLTMVNAYNKAISEKANDVDFFADAYLKILGALLDEKGMKNIRDNRIINFEGEGAEKLIVEFMEKPSADETQEHLLDRLERLIFHIGQTANVSDENFGTSSGIAMLYKIWSTSNMGKTKERKFTSGMNRRYKILFSSPLSKVPKDAWVGLHYTFVPNIPKNVLEETQIAQNVEGIVSKKTQLKTLSIVDNVDDEIERIEEENEPDENTLVDRLMFPNNPVANAAEENPNIDNSEKV